MQRRILLAFCLLFSLAFTTGCDRIGLILHTKTHIAKVPVKSAELDLTGTPGIAPGQSKSLIATFQDDKQKVWTTQGAGKGKILWSDLSVNVDVATYKKGVITLPYDPRVSQGKTVHISMTVPSHPGIAAQVEVPLRYDYPFKAVYYGAAGSPGIDGTPGSSGSPGSPGSIDPNNPSAGGDGGNGGNGGDGTDGGDGGPGPDVAVRITMQAGAKPMIQAVSVVQGHRDRYYLIDPNGGTLTIQSNGGPGGRGGSGGAGGSGGPGGSGDPPGNSGSNGSDGNAGSDGSDGAPGHITVTYDPSVKPYMSAIHMGEPGGPAPVVQQGTVPPLW